MYSVETENVSSDHKEDLLVSMLILAFAAFSWCVYAFVNRSWFAAFGQVMAWLGNPTINYASLQVEGLPQAVFAVTEVLVLGALCSKLLLNKEKDFVVKFVTALGLGAGLTGLIVIILAIFGSLYQLPLNLAVLTVCVISLSVIVYRGKANSLSLKQFLTSYFSLPMLQLPSNLKLWLPACLAIMAVFFFSFYHALSTVIVHWDALVYHAAMANIMYNEHAIPLIVGPSIGLEMSANFPPLYSALGAYVYTQIGSVQDVYLRLIAPIMGLLTVLATYKIGEIAVGKKFGLIAALFLALTPLFFRYSIYATSYSTLTFFCTVTILFLVLAIGRGGAKYWVASGVFFGFATLTSYIALYLAPFLLIALLAHLLIKRTSFRLSFKNSVLLLVSALLVGGVWYLRNLILVDNPIYPNAYTVLGGLNIDPLIMQTTFAGIKQSAVVSFFGGDVSIFEQIMTFLTYRTSYPAISLLTVLAVILLPTIKNRKLWLIALWPLTLGFLVLSGVSWGFPRHIVFAMPGFALLSAVPILKLLDFCRSCDLSGQSNFLQRINPRLPKIRVSNLLRLGLAAVLLVGLVFPSLTLVMGGKVWAENLNDQVPADYLWFLKNPNADTWAAASQLYPEADAWQYINANLSEGERVATVENRLYYVKNCSNDYFFYLDGWEARDLYNITDPAQMVQFLRDRNVKFVVDVSWARDHGHFEVLPLSKYLGDPSPYFPTLFNNASNPAIYNVGPIQTPLTDSSPLPLSINTGGWSEIVAINGVQTQSVIADSDAARLYVSTENLTEVSITYLDCGTGSIAVNIRDPNSLEWYNGVAVIQKTNTGQWKNYDFIAPIAERGYVELGIHAYHENFTVKRIVATPYQAIGRTAVSSINSTISMQITNNTLPPTATVYLPMLNKTDTIKINAISNGQPICIELYRGIIQPREATSWWLNHDLTSRSPNSTEVGEVTPSLTWQVDQCGSYTVVIVLRDSYHVGAQVDLQITCITSNGGAIK
ncbi:glycosyltransferase family 39 protein [Candidatus Bathyarchaeota archaeon]|nr:glycosyltransferase family 39 protein [Candidatus Bathyarchaeota archaeon]